MRKLGCTTILFIVSVFVGCDSRTPTAHPSTTQSAATKSPARFGWYSTWDADPQYVATTHLTAPGIFHDKTQEIALKQYLRVDAEGLEQMIPGPSGVPSESVDGRTGTLGFGYNGCIDVENADHDDSIVFHIDYSWTTPNQIEGSMHERVTVKVGVPAAVEFPGGRSFSVTWRGPLVKIAPHPSPLP